MTNNIYEWVVTGVWHWQPMGAKPQYVDVFKAAIKKQFVLV